jgi:hypothetical protein
MMTAWACQRSATPREAGGVLRTGWCIPQPRRDASPTSIGAIGSTIGRISTRSPASDPAGASPRADAADIGNGKARASDQAAAGELAGDRAECGAMSGVALSRTGR